MLYVSMRDEGKIKTIDVDSFTVTGEVSVGVGSQPESLILTPDERILIVSLRGLRPDRRLDWRLSTPGT